MIKFPVAPHRSYKYERSNSNSEEGKIDGRLVPELGGKKRYIAPYMPCVGILTNNKEIKLSLDHSSYPHLRTRKGLIKSDWTVKSH